MREDTTCSKCGGTYTMGYGHLCPAKEGTKLEQIKAAFLAYTNSEGCGCCEDQPEHSDAAKEMCQLLEIKDEELGRI